jgi:phage tail sheath protein FI
MATTYLAPGVYVEEVSGGSKPIEGVGTSVAGFIGFADEGPFDTPTLVTNWSQYSQTFGGSKGPFKPGAYLAHSVYGYFNNGGGVCYVVRLRTETNGHQSTPAQQLIPSRTGAVNGSLQVTALTGVPEGVVAEISAATPEPPAAAGEAARGRRAGQEPAAGEPAAADVGDADARFTLKIRSGLTEEVFDNVSMKRNDANFVEKVVNQGIKKSKLVSVKVEAGESDSINMLAPNTGQFPLQAAPTLAVEKVSPAQYLGDTAERTGLGGFDAIDELTIVCAPDLMSAYQNGMINEEGVRAVQTAMIDHCERNGDRVAILDAPPDMKPQAILDWRMNEAKYDSSYAALYYPWIRVADPSTGKVFTMPPSGHLAGVWARVDGERGVHKAPANETIRGCIDIDFQVTTNEQTLLNPKGINCIRAFPGRGIRIWGARTLSSDPEWRYLNVRRLFNFVEKSVFLGTQWAVFEPNNLDLWLKLKRDISSFLTRVYMTGALFGATSRESFFVKCDSETNPQESIDAGMVVCLVGIAPTKPAEFVIFRISQMTPGAA